MTLDQLKIGETANLVKIDSQSKLRRRLMEMGMTPGVKLSMLRVAPLGDPLEISVRGTSLSLRKQDAALITCES